LVLLAILTSLLMASQSYSRQRRKSGGLAAPEVERMRMISVPLAPSPMRPKVCIVGDDDDEPMQGRLETEAQIAEDTMNMDLETSPKSPVMRKNSKSFMNLTGKRSSRFLFFDADVNATQAMEPLWFFNDVLTPYALCLLTIIVRYWIIRGEMKGKWKVDVGKWIIRWIYNLNDPVDVPLNELLEEMRLCFDKEYGTLAEYCMQQVRMGVASQD
jgi:hypothetical protein